MHDASSRTAHKGALPVQDTVALPPQVIRSLWGLLGDGECHGNVTVTYRKLPTGRQSGIPSSILRCVLYLLALCSLRSKAVGAVSSAQQQHLCPSACQSAQPHQLSILLPVLSASCCLVPVLFTFISCASLQKSAGSVALSACPSQADPSSQAPLFRV